KPGFTIRLTYSLPEQDAPHTQETELCEDTGDHHIGVSVKSVKHEYFHGQFDLLIDEKQRHDDCRTYRRTRRNRKRYRKPRFNNRYKKDGWFAPSVENKTQCHTDIFAMFAKVLLIQSVTLETARFDTQLLEAQQTGNKTPAGTDYQHGPKFKLINLREAVFTRDGYTCQICGKSVSDGVILRVHHALYWKGDHTDRLSGLMTVCDKCHTPKNHQKGGRLWGITPKIKSMAGAAFMNTIRWHIVDIFKKRFPGIEIHVTNGAATKASRRLQRMAKTHANDAYCMGRFRPGHKAHEAVYQKRRRNNRVLSKFYDAQYIDVRDGKKRPGKDFSCNRTDRSVPRNNANSLRIYRGRKISKGHCNIRRRHYLLQAGDAVMYKGIRRTVKGLHGNGANVEFVPDGVLPKSAKSDRVTVIRYASGWRLLSRLKPGVPAAM
ncbi:MAG: RNA-guided endonuclease IscB, partial [Candidatus Weimeria sp.]